MSRQQELEQRILEMKRLLDCDQFDEAIEILSRDILSRKSPDSP